MKKNSFVMLLVLSLLISVSVSAWTKKSTDNLQVFFGINGNSSFDNLDQTVQALEFHLQQTKNELASISVSTSSPMVTVRASSSLVAVTSNGNTTSLLGNFSLDIRATGRGDIFPYTAEVVLRNVQTGAYVASSTVRLVPNESGNDIPVAHKMYGNITVSKVAEGAVKRYSVTSSIVPKGTQTVNYIMELRNITYFNSDLIATNAPSMPAKNILLTGLENTKTNIATYDGTAQVTPSTPALNTNLTVGSQGAEVIILQNFLIAKGFLAAGINTGYFGASTQTAVKAYQVSKGISPADGFVNATTRAAINAELAAPTGGNRRATPPPAPTTATSGQAVPLKASFFKDFFKNVQAQVIYMFGK